MEDWPEMQEPNNGVERDGADAPRLTPSVRPSIVMPIP